MFDFSALLTKPMLIGILVLSIACAGLSGTVYFYKKKNERLQKDLAITADALDRLNDAAKKQRELHQTTLSALQRREMERDNKAREAVALRNRLRAILRQTEDACLNSDIPMEVIELLRKPKND